MEKTIKIIGTSIVEVERTYKIIDTEKFKEVLHQFENNIISIDDLFKLNIIEFMTIPKGCQVGEILEDVEYTHIFCDDEEISQIIEDIQSNY